MPIETPEQFELKSLESFIKIIDSGGYKGTKKVLILCVLGSSVVLAITYFLNRNSALPQDLVFFMAACFGGLILASVAFNYSIKQSEYLLPYLNSDEIRKRIDELKM